MAWATSWLLLRHKAVVLHTSCVVLVVIGYMQSSVYFQVEMLFDDEVFLFFFKFPHFISCFIKPSHLQQQAQTWNKPSADEQAEHLFYFKSWKCTSGPLTRADLSDFPPDTGRFTPRKQTECNRPLLALLTAHTLWQGQLITRHYANVVFTAKQRFSSKKKKDSSPCQVGLNVCVCVCLSLQGWMTVSSSTSRLLRGRKSGETSCCGSPTRSWRTWGCPGSDTRSSSWRPWTCCVLWWVPAPHSVFPAVALPLRNISDTLVSSWCNINPTITNLECCFVLPAPKVFGCDVLNQASHLRNQWTTLSKESLSH